MTRGKQELGIRMALDFTTAKLEVKQKLEKCLQNAEGKGLPTEFYTQEKYQSSREVEKVFPMYQLSKKEKKKTYPYNAPCFRKLLV